MRTGYAAKTECFEAKRAAAKKAEAEAKAKAAEGYCDEDNPTPNAYYGKADW